MCGHLICSACDNLTAREKKITVHFLVLLFLKSQHSYHIISLLLQKENHKAHSLCSPSMYTEHARVHTQMSHTLSKVLESPFPQPTRTGSPQLVKGFGTSTHKAQQRQIFISTTAGHLMPMLLFETIIVSLVQLSK